MFERKTVQRKPSIKSIVESFAADIENGHWAANAKLPSLRKLAEDRKISKSSAVEIYERLLALELIEVRGNQGFFVKQRSAKPDTPHPVPKTVTPADPPDRRGRFPTKGFHPSGGWLGSHTLPLEALRFALRETARAKTDELLNYTDPRGFLPLRKLLVDRFATLGIKSRSESVLITDSASMAIDMICRLMLSPGDTVFVDDPTSLNFTSMIKLYGVKVVGVPFAGTERDLEALRRLVSAHRPKLYLLSPVLHNPTGSSITTNQAFDLLVLMREAGVYVVEDDVYADLDENATTRLSALSGQAGLAYIGSFSKTISPSLRCGFISCEPHIAKQLAERFAAASFGLNTLTSITTYKLLNSGLYRRNLRSLQKTVADERKTAVNRLESIGFEVPYKPKGGVFVWARWPGPASARLISDVALESGVVLAPGESFSPSARFGDHIRFNCTLMQTGGLYPRLKQILKDADKRARA
ncbi:PLP-dependent aminotransferase family protein [Roseovarius bejariae]|uniref:aminotransferase-like domain-containing protein n=1 Tax=Roseovarius bejariae TaxID=2576383 RepID=UPI001561BCD3|nr:PLP-dependent aminotransferase family protein [Roseovarius bejariae]